MKKMGLVALMALLCLPMVALAVREGVVEDAPMVEAQKDQLSADAPRGG